MNKYQFKAKKKKKKEPWNFLFIPVMLWKRMPAAAADSPAPHLLNSEWLG